MKKLILLLMISFLAVPEMIYSQNSSVLRASRRSFSAAQNNYKDGNYEQAIREYKIVINTIPANIDSRGDLTNRLESLIDIIDIYFSKYVNITKACEYVEIYKQDMNVVRTSGVLRTGQMLEFQQKEQEYISDYMPKCESYEKSGDDMDRFRRDFDEEF